MPCDLLPTCSQCSKRRRKPFTLINQRSWRGPIRAPRSSRRSERPLPRLRGGRPYDTLEEVIGLRGTPGHGSLAESGVTYAELPRPSNSGAIDWAALPAAITPGGQPSMLGHRLASDVPRQASRCFKTNYAFRVGPQASKPK